MSASPPTLNPTAEAALQPADLQTYLHELPIAAAILPRLQSMLLSDGTSIADIVDLIMLDPGLAVRVMHAAGSTVYGRGEPVSSLEEALARLGSHEVYRVTAAFAMSKFLNKPLRLYGLDSTLAWRRSIACALVMVDLAPACGLDDRVAYTAGLLHSIGMLFIDRHLRASAHARVQLAPRSAPVPVQERRLTGMTHAQVAGIVLRQWNFGDDVVAPIEFQYEPGRAGAHRAMASLLAEAREIAAEIVEQLPLPGGNWTSPGTQSPRDEWIGEIAQRILVIEGSAR